MTGFEVPIGKCPSCGYQFDMAIVILSQEQAPSPGDMTVCIQCGHVMAFSENLTPRKLTDEEMYRIAGDPRLIALQKARKKALEEEALEEERGRER